MRRSSVWLMSILAVIITADQLTKAWAWRHLSDVYINSGGSVLFGTGVGTIMKDPVWGAAVDVLDAVLLAACAAVLVRRRRPVVVLVGAGLLVAGWTSNLLDRLGMHYVTAPGSVRGAVDFLYWRGRYWNLADFAILIGTVVLVLALPLAVTRGRRVRARRPRLAAPRTGTRIAAVGAIATTCALAGFGAFAYSGVNSTVALAAAR